MTEAPTIPMLARHVSEIVDEAVAETELIHEYPDAIGLRTGIDALDRHIAPALVPGSLIVLAGESGNGKTALATQLAVGFAHQVPTLVLTLEDSARDTVKRALANVSRESISAIRGGFPNSGLPVSFESAAAHLSSLPLSYIDDLAPAVEDVGRQVVLWKKHNAVEHGVVIIDQLSHISPTSSAVRPLFEKWRLPIPPHPGSNETVQLEWRTHMMKLVAQRQGLTVVLVHQLNENHGDGKPTLSSIRGSRGIAHKADLVLCPWRPTTMEDPFAGPGEPNRVPAPEGHAVLLGLKGRQIPVFEEQVSWVGAQQRFADRGDEHADYTPVEEPTERAKEGARKLAELRERFRQARPEVVAAAQPKELPEPAPEYEG